METELLLARIGDTALLCERTSRPKFLGFLSAEQAVLAEKTVRKTNVRYGFWGGYDSAERVMLGCFPDWADEADYPITAVSFTFRRTDSVGHRDVLGSLMGLGIKREAVGDILLEDGRAVVFLSSEIADFAVSQTEKIGRTGVKAQIGFTSPLPQRGALCDCSATIASDRLDCVVAALVGTSRSRAAEKIVYGEVSVNSVACDKVTKSISSGDIVTVRGKGKFVVSDLSGRTAKNRVVMKYKKYA